MFCGGKVQLMEIDTLFLDLGGNLGGGRDGIDEVYVCCTQKWEYSLEGYRGWRVGLIF